MCAIDRSASTLRAPAWDELEIDGKPGARECILPWPEIKLLSRKKE